MKKRSITVLTLLVLLSAVQVGTARGQQSPLQIKVYAGDYSTAGTVRIYFTVTVNGSVLVDANVSAYVIEPTSQNETLSLMRIHTGLWFADYEVDWQGEHLVVSTADYQGWSSVGSESFTIDSAGYTLTALLLSDFNTTLIEIRDTFEEDLALVQGDLADLDLKVGTVKTRTDELKTKLDTVSNSVSGLSSELSQVETTLRGEIVNLNNQITEVRNKVVDLHNLVDTVQEDVTNLGSDVESGNVNQLALFLMVAGSLVLNVMLVILFISRTTKKNTGR